MPRKIKFNPHDGELRPTSEYCHYHNIVMTNDYIIGHNYHGHYLHAGGLGVNNYVRENKVREVNVRE